MSAAYLCPTVCKTIAQVGRNWTDLVVILGLWLALGFLVLRAGSWGGWTMGKGPSAKCALDITATRRLRQVRGGKPLMKCMNKAGVGDKNKAGA